MKTLLVLIILTVTVLGVSHVALTQSSTCPALIETALALTDRSCTGMNRNQACYGHAQLEAEAQFGTLDFEMTGDRADLTALRSLRVSALDVANGLWGVAMLKVNARLINADLPEPVTFLLFGDSAIETRVLVDSVPVTVNSARNINLRLAPSTDGFVLATLTRGATATARGQLADGSWVYVETETGQRGWVISGALASDTNLNGLSVLQPENAYFGAMQAFTLQTGEAGTLCGSLPENGLLVQTPDGIAEVSLWINEVKVRLGSTAYITAQPGANMTIAMLEGHAEVEAFGVTSTAVAGAQITIPLDDDGMASGPPSAPAPIAADTLDALPVTLLEREIPPLNTLTTFVPSAEELGQNGAGSGESSTVSGQNTINLEDCTGNRCNAPGQEGCPGNRCDAPGHGNTPPGQGGSPPGGGNGRP